MFWLKQCPQCGGDLLDESDVYGSYISCLQCGRTLTAAEEQALRQALRLPGDEPDWDQREIYNRDR